MLSEFSTKSIKSALSFTKKPGLRSTDAHLNYLCRNGRLTEAITVLDSIAKQGSKVRGSTYINLLQSCIDFNDIQLGRKLHANINLVSEIDVFVETKLVSMYAKCGCFNDAFKVFDGMRERNLYTWSAVIGARSREQRWREVVELFFLMITDGVLPDDFLFPKILQACGNCGDFETGKLIHCLVIKLGMTCVTRVKNSILAVYVKCGKMSWARRFFKSMDERDRVAWNSMISGYCQIGENEQAHRFFDEMCKEGIEPEDAERVFDMIKEKDIYTLNSMIGGYCQAGYCSKAYELFMKMQESDIPPDVITWNAMISGYIQNGNEDEAMDLFRRMEEDGKVKRNSASWNALIAGDHSKSYSDLLYSWLQKILENIKAHHSHSGLSIEEEEKEEISGVHSEKLALAFALVGSSPAPQSIRIVKNIRMCGDCHETAKYVSMTYGFSDEWLIQISEYHPSCHQYCFPTMASRRIPFGDVVVMHLAITDSEISSIRAKVQIDFIVQAQNDEANRCSLWNWLLWSLLGTMEFQVGSGSQLSSVNQAKMLCESLVEGEKKPVAVGPWGGQNGVHWDDGVYTTVRQLVIAHGAGIDSIQIEYDKKGSQVWSVKHGGNGGSKLDKVTLEYPDEFLTAVHGHYGTVNDWGAVCVRSLTFQSNKKTYGPFGIEQGTYFSFPMTGGKIVGFHGRSGWNLDAIGVYLKPLHNKNSSKTIVHSQSFLTNGSEKVGYSLVQGSVGESYDIVLAVKQKDSFGANHLPTILSRQSSSTSLDSSSDEDNKTKHNKMHSNDKLRSMDKLPIKVNGVLSYGPWGGSGGSTFDDGNFTGVRQINISRNVGIVSIRVCYDRDGQAVWGSKHGGTGGFRNDRVIFDYPYEILTHITGTYGPLMYMGPNIIKSLTFHTTKGKHGPFGEEQGPSFTHKMNEGKIVGFHGKEGLFLDAIGVHVMEGKVSPQSHPVSNAINKSEGPIAEIDNPQWSNKLLVAKRGPTEEVACAVIKEPAPFGPGPWGGDGGRPWDDGVYSGVKQIFVTRGEAINSIQIEYDRNGQSVWSIKHGGNGGSFTHRIKMEYPHEMLNCLSGYYGPVSTDDKSKVIKSLTFYTSRGKYGPYGEEVGTYFTSTTTEGKIVGFHGRSSYYLDAIGVHMQHWLGNTQRTTRSFFKFLN
ncbi:hypothetical protein Pint_09030 [Pistacia integerrima]|uniref:Uncharacterized protein n=1 Tax=Pistacia integerrima TaxID=434235 RepID=A0ACC0Y0M2_9ROSI|nr:hypothetical protein Pint_09030 [Pistacia integerrima]